MSLSVTPTPYFRPNPMLLASDIPSSTFHLPPAATPLVVILANVPPAPCFAQESCQDLLAKTKAWFFNNLNSVDDVVAGISMVRRVRWICKSRKIIPNDCIIVNFSKSHLAAKVLSLSRNPFSPTRARSEERL